MTMSDVTSKAAFNANKVNKVEDNNNVSVIKDNNIKKAGGNKKKSYSLRTASLQKRMDVETRQKQPRKRGPKPRPKSGPMSKYRRKTANLRERMRMGEINVAFEKLRDKLPNPMTCPGPSKAAKCEKLTKINILHVAINYIRAMENILETGDSGVKSFSEMTKNPLRDEAEKKADMQRVLQTLMARADNITPYQRKKKRSASSNNNNSGSRNKKSGKPSKPLGRLKPPTFEESSSSSDEEAMDQEMEEKSDSSDDFDEDYENSDSWTAIEGTTIGSTEDSVSVSVNNLSSTSSASILTSDWSLSSPTTSGSGSQPRKSSDPLFGSTLEVLPSGSGSSSHNSSLSSSSSSSSTPMISKILTASSTANHCAIPGSGGDDIMRDFTDFVELVDSLHGMPDLKLEFDDALEMFP